MEWQILNFFLEFDTKNYWNTCHKIILSNYIFLLIEMKVFCDYFCVCVRLFNFHVETLCQDQWTFYFPHEKENI